MKHHLIATFAAAAVAAPVLTWATSARADDAGTYFVPPTPVVPVRAESTYTGPSRALLTTGLVMFTGAYVPSVIVAAANEQPADHHLYVPVVGPWLDLADRPPCGARSIGCGTEATNKALLIASGAFQGVGVVVALSSFLFREHGGYVVTAGAHKPKAARAENPSLRVTPTAFGSGAYGVAAFGGF